MYATALAAEIAATKALPPGADFALNAILTDTALDQACDKCAMEDAHIDFTVEYVDMDGKTELLDSCADCAAEALEYGNWDDRHRVTVWAEVQR